jgi:Amt family ammonium transporter
VSALVVALLIGRRTASSDRMEPHDVPMTVLGAGLLWFGWFGFNAGSALAANGLAANALIVTNTAAAAGTITWVLASYAHKRKVSVVGAVCGAVAGLVAVTPASGFVTAGGALLIGLVAGALCYSATLLRERIKIDDALDVFAVHGVGGMLGAVGTGVLATGAVNAYPGLIDGNPGQVVTQLIAIAATVGFAVASTFGIVKVVDFVLGIRVPSQQEEVGLDLAVHGEVAYQP